MGGRNIIYEAGVFILNTEVVSASIQCMCKEHTNVTKATPSGQVYKSMSLPALLALVCVAVA